MCMEYSKECECGQRKASFHFQDNVMPTEVVSRLYCPFCETPEKFDPVTTIEDNGWRVEYDMELAEFSATGLPRQAKESLSPATLFDDGYASWRGIYPGDHIDSVKEREEIIKLAKTDPREYMTQIRDWANSRMDRLAKDGWRKANAIG